MSYRDESPKYKAARTPAPGTPPPPTRRAPLPPIDPFSSFESIDLHSLASSGSSQPTTSLVNRNAGTQKSTQDAKPLTINSGSITLAPPLISTTFSHSSAPLTGPGIYVHATSAIAKARQYKRRKHSKIMFLLSLSTLTSLGLFIGMLAAMRFTHHSVSTASAPMTTPPGPIGNINGNSNIIIALATIIMLLVIGTPTAWLLGNVERYDEYMGFNLHVKGTEARTRGYMAIVGVCLGGCVVVGWITSFLFGVWLGKGACIGKE